MPILKYLYRHEVKLLDLLQANERRPPWYLRVFLASKLTDAIGKYLEAIRICFQNYVHYAKHSRSNPHPRDNPGSMRSPTRRKGCVNDEAPVQAKSAEEL